jgi:hypothetical protein
MTVNVLYLQQSLSRNPNPLAGRRLFERFQREARRCRLGYIVHPDEITEAMPDRQDYVTPGELAALQPDLIYVEGGFVEEFVWRIPQAVLEPLLTDGAVVIAGDVDWNTLNRRRAPYDRFLKFCRVTVDYDGPEPVQLRDPQHCYHSPTQIICRPADMAYEAWLAPVYQDLPEFVVAGPVPLRAWGELVATCNRSSTRSRGDDYDSGPFAAACRLGLGYLVLIAGGVSADRWTGPFPGNIEWLTRLAHHLVERVRIDRRRNEQLHQIFISHRHSNREFAHAFRDELRRRGFGAWLDVRELIAGDELTPELRQAIDESSHFSLIWSADCVGARWIELELDHALAVGKRLFIIRLDDTPVPAAVADRIRIEAQALPPAEAARLVATSVEYEQQRGRPT